MATITTIEGIGETYAAKLRDAGVATVEGLLERCSDAPGRKELAELTGISKKMILNWTNHADLSRVRGVAGQYSELLERSGVDTVVELAHRNAENLTATLAEVNERLNLVRALPSLSMVEDWIEQAKQLPRMITH